MSTLPAALNDLVTLFEALPEGERREALIDLASAAPTHAPKAAEIFDLVDLRKDAECSDTVGIHVRMEAGERVHFAVTLGPKVQTLTRALAVLLCRGLNGSTLSEVLAVPQDFVPRVIGAELVRLRSQTVYYVLRRMQEAALTLQNKSAR